MALYLKRAGGLQFSNPPQLARSGPGVDGLVFYAPLSEQAELGAHELVAGEHQSSGIIHPGITPAGYGRFRTDTNSNLSFNFYDRHKFGTGPFSCAVYGLLDSVAGSAASVISNSLTGPGPANQWRILTNYNGAGAAAGALTFFTFDGTVSQVAVGAGLGVDPDKPCWYIGVRRAGGVLQLWRDTILLAETTLTARNVSGSITDPISVGWVQTSSTGRAITRAAAWNRAIMPFEIAAIVANPDALVTRRSVWYPRATAPGTTVAVPQGALTLTGLAPSVVVTANQTVAVPAGALTLTGLVPTVTTSANQTVAVPKGALTLTGNAPTVVVGDQQIVLVPAGVLNITGFAPVVIAGGPVVVSVPAGSLSLTGYAPTVDTGGRRNNAAGKVKRRKYEIQGKTYALTPGELEQVLSLVMREEEAEEEAPKVVAKAVKEVAKAVAAVPVKAPTYEAKPAFDTLWADMTRQREHEAAETLRRIAQQIHEKAIFDDDQDIVDILALIQ